MKERVERVRSHEQSRETEKSERGRRSEREKKALTETVKRRDRVLV